jgi:hypothetical protein
VDERRWSETARAREQERVARMVRRKKRKLKRREHIAIAYGLPRRAA